MHPIASHCGRLIGLLSCLVVLSSAVQVGLGNPAVRKKFEPMGIAALAFSFDGRFLVSAGLDETVRVWNPANGKLLWRVVGHKGGAYAVTCAPDGKQVFSGGADSRIRIWDVQSGKEVAEITGHTGGVTSLVCSADGKLLISGSYDKTIRFWDLATRKQVRSITAHGEGVLTLGMTSDNLLISTGEKKEILGGGHFIVTGPDKAKLWNLTTGKEVRSYDIESDLVMLSYDRKFLATSGTETKVIGTTLTQRKVAGLRDAATGEMLCELGINSPHRAAFSPDGKLLASVDGDSFLRLWEVVTGKQVCKEMKRAGTSLAFSPDGKRIASGTSKGEVIFADVPPDLDKWVKKAKDADRDKLWGQLAGDDPVAAYEAIWTLTATPKETLALLKARLKRPAPATDVKQIQKLIDELDSDRFAIREAAMAKLRKLGREAELPMREALDSGKLSLEARRRVQRLVTLLKLPFPWKGESLREVRALHLLEMLDTPEATALLKNLAEGPRTSALVQDAKRILERQMARKGKSRPLP